MQHLPEKWLRRYNYLYIGYFLVMFGLYIRAAIAQDNLLINTVPAAGLNLGVAIMSLVGLLYNFAVLRKLKKYNLWVAYVASYSLFGIANAMAVEVALNQPLGPLFIGITYAHALLSVSLGPIVGMAVIAITGVILGMIVAGTTTPTAFGLKFDIASFVSRTVIITSCLYLLRNRYADEGSQNESYISQYFVNNDVVELLTNSINDAVLIIDQDGNIKSVNAGAVKLFGQMQQTMLNVQYQKLFQLKTLQNNTLDKGSDPLVPALKLGKASTGEFILSRQRGEDLYVDIAVSPIRNAGTKTIYGAVAIVRDVNQRKREETARSEFISTASHEMRTPVAAIDGYLELALGPTSNIDVRTRDYLKKAQANTKHLSQLFQDLLSSAKAEDGRLSNQPEAVEMNEFLSQLSEDFKVIASHKGLGLDFIIGTDETARSLPLTKPLYHVFADPERLREVLTNIFDNAIKYTEKGKITLGLTGNDTVVQFFVQDTGRGIPKQDIPKLFQKFYRAEATESQTTGTGLGLFLCKKIIELYDGKIWVESETNKGSTFYVTLPRLDSSKLQSLIDQQIAKALPRDNPPQPALPAAPVATATQVGATQGRQPAR